MGDADDQEELASLRTAAQTYRLLLDNASDAIFIHDGETGEIVDVNDTMLRMYGVTREEALGADAEQFSQGEAPFGSQDAARWIGKAASEGPQVFEWQARRKNGEVFTVEVALSRADIDGKPKVLAIVRDVSRRKLAEEALAYRVRFEELIATISTHFVSVPIDDVDREIEVALGEVARFAGTNSGYLMHFHADDSLVSMTHLWNDGVLLTDKRTVKNLPVDVMPWWMKRIFANQVVAVSSVSALPGEAMVEKSIIEAQGVRAVIDVPLVVQGKTVGFLGFNSAKDRREWTESEISLLRFVGHVFESALARVRAERALRNSEEQLVQAQKMEAIGRLAGGIAHDFNNLLTAIVGYSELALAGLRPEDAVHKDLTEIMGAATRATDLTRQLLAFSRKQVGSPRRIDLNEVFGELRRMVGRIIGEDVQLTFSPSEKLWPVLMDPRQFDQVMVNLATNSRDAMPEGGRLTVETANVRCDEAFCAQHGGMRPGDYVMIAVSDTGVGIPQPVQAQIFEPFFSTKEEGKGTGLGLSTVYGLVRQAGGLVTVYSQEWLGSTFRIYLPRAAGGGPSETAPARAQAPAQGKARILLVEDENFVRTLAARILRQHGYTVVEAGDPAEAIASVEGEGPFDLLLTDVVMPTMKGPELYRELESLQENLVCLYMSGYAENVILHQGAAPAGTRLLQKPFTIASLTAAVRDALATRVDDGRIPGRSGRSGNGTGRGA